MTRTFRLLPWKGTKQMDLDQVLATWRAWQETQNLSERSITERANCVRRYARDSGEDPLQFTTGGLMLFIARPGLKPRTRWTYHQHLRSYGQWLIKAKLRSDDPLSNAPTPRKPSGVPRPVQNYQFERILAAALSPRTRTMILLAAFAGLRVHEIAKVRGEDVDLDAATLRVFGKGGKDATIPLHELLFEEALLYPSKGYWFPSTCADGHMGRIAVSELIGEAMRRAGVQATAHQLRHWYGTSLLEKGVDIRVVQELMRHSSLQSTQIYTQVSGAQRQIAIATLGLPTAAA